MSSSHFLLPFKDKEVKKPVSVIALSLLVVVTLIFILVNSTYLDILIVYFTTFIILSILGGRFFKTLNILASAYVIIFFLGLPSFFLHTGYTYIPVAIGKVVIKIYPAAARRAIFIWIRGLLSVSIVTLYSTMLTVQEFIQALKSLFLPNILVTLILLILRYTPMLYEQGTEVKISQELRGIQSAPYRRKFAAATSRLGGTLIRSFQKGTEVYEGMVLRGLENSEFVRRTKTKWLDWIIIPIITGLYTLIAGGFITWLI